MDWLYNERGPEILYWLRSNLSVRTCGWDWNWCLCTQRRTFSVYLFALLNHYCRPSRSVSSQQTAEPPTQQALRTFQRRTDLSCPDGNAVTQRRLPSHWTGRRCWLCQSSPRSNGMMGPKCASVCLTCPTLPGPFLTDCTVQRHDGT
jgi:hypothetical protein